MTYHILVNMYLLGCFNYKVLGPPNVYTYNHLVHGGPVIYLSVLKHKLYVIDITMYVYHK